MNTPSSNVIQRQLLERNRRADDYLRAELNQDEPLFSNEWLQEFDGRLGKKFRGDDND